MPSGLSADTSQRACADDQLGQLAELAGVDCVHLEDVSIDAARLALIGVAVYSHLQPEGQRAVDAHIESLPTGTRAAVQRARDQHRHGAVIYENDSGNQRIVRGRSFDFDALGIRPQRLRAHDVNFHYMLLDGHFVFFPDNPDLYYYIQSARYGTLNFGAAWLAQKAAEMSGPWFTASFAQRVPAGERALERLSGLKEESIFYGILSGIFFRKRIYQSGARLSLHRFLKAAQRQLSFT